MKLFLRRLLWFPAMLLFGLFFVLAHAGNLVVGLFVLVGSFVVDGTVRWRLFLLPSLSNFFEFPHFPK